MLFRLMNSHRVKGSISIFLCLIMLPMVTYSTMIIDSSRLQSARSIIASAGDLTMNAAMSEYEQILQDMYGLFAVAQNEGDLKPALQAYFQQTIEAQISNGETRDDYAQWMSEEIVNQIFSEQPGNPEDNWANFLRMKIDEFNYSEVPGSALANPAVMKRQVIDYMKYKGPVSLACTLFRKLNFLKNSSKQADAVDKKVEYTKTLKDLEDPCKRAYYSIVGVDNDEYYYVGYNPVADSWNELYTLAGADGTPGITNLINFAKEQYKYMTASKILYESAPFQSGISYSDLQDWGATNYDTISRMGEDDSGQVAAKLDAYIRERNRIINPDSAYSGAFEDAMGSIYFTIQTDNDNYWTSAGNAVVNTGAEDSRFYFPVLSRIQDGGTWKAVLDEECMPQSSSESERWSKEETRYNLQKDINNNLDDFRQYVQWRTDYDYLAGEIIRLANLYDDKVYDEGYRDADGEGDWDPDDAFLSQEVNNPSSALHNYIWESKASSYIKNKLNEKYNEAFNNFLSSLGSREIYNTYAAQYEDSGYGMLCPAYTHLLSMKETLEELNSALDDVITAFQNVQEAKEAWQGAVNQVDSGSTRTAMQNDIDTATDGIDIDEVRTLQSTASGIKDEITAMITDMESIKYLGQQICRTQTMSDLAELVEANFIQQTLVDLYAPDDAFPCPPDFSGVSEFADNRLTSTENANTAMTKATTIINDTTKFTHSVDPSHFKLLEIIDGDPEETEKFFKVLEDICNPVESADMNEETQQQYDNINNEADNVGDNGTPSGSSADQLDNTEDAQEVEQDNPASESIGDFYSDIHTYCELSESEQDTLNAEAYSTGGMDMPSGDDDGSDPSGSLDGAKGLLSLIGDLVISARDKAYMEEYFTEMFTCRTDALRSAEVVLLNGYSNADDAAKKLNTNTEWYGKEIEYIIWGDSDLGDNLIKNDAMIFTIRFALNAIYAFTATDIQSFALEVATAIAGWTVIGVPIVQACITLGIALAESAWDLHLLHQGKDVPIYKNASTFVCSPTGALTAIGTELATEAITAIVDEATSQLEENIDNAIDNLNVQANETVSQYANQMTDYINEYIDQQTEQIRSSIESLFVTPLINKIQSVPQLVRVQGMTVDEAISYAVDEAFSVVEGRISQMNDGKMKEITQLFFNACNDGTIDLKSGLSSRLSGLFTNLTGAEGDSIVVDAAQIRNALIAPANPTTGESGGVITQALVSFDSTLTSKMNELKTEMLTNFQNATNEAAGNLKDFFHEQMETISSEINGTVSDAMSSLVSDNTANNISSVVTDGADAAASGGGFTLNYKEYCKIFVLLNVMANEEKMLQRAAALIQANCRHPENGNLAVDGFEMREANTLVSVHASMELNTLFPWCVTDEIDEYTGDNNISFDISNLGGSSVLVNYNGINGY